MFSVYLVLAATMSSSDSDSSEMLAYFASAQDNATYHFNSAELGVLSECSDCSDDELLTPAAASRQVCRASSSTRDKRGQYNRESSRKRISHAPAADNFSTRSSIARKRAVCSPRVIKPAIIEATTYKQTTVLY